MIKKDRELLTWIGLIVIAVTVVFAASSLSGQADKTAPKNDTVTVSTTSTTTTTVVTFSSPGQLSGAIFTTNPDGSIVNENVWYEAKKEVYLDGGPPPNAPVTSAGLPEGLYVFQVTNPSGAYLLSEDPAKCRIINISSDGVIIDLVAPSTLGLGLEDSYTVITKAAGAQGKGPKNQGTVFQCHIADPPTPPNTAGPTDAGPSEHHDTNTDVDHWSDYNAIVVQLMPFLDTPNPGGVYKAWVTPIADYIDHGGDLNETPYDYVKKKGKTMGFKADPGFGPPRSDVKTDNFKVKEKHVKPPPELRVLKFHDLNANGVWDAGEPEIGVDECVETGGTYDPECSTGGGWPVNITEPSTLTTTKYTPFSYIAAEPGDYIVEEWEFSNWHQSVAILDDVSLGIVNPVTVNIEADYKDEEEHEIIFGNYMPANISGRKFIDMNGNGEYDGSDEDCANANTVNIPGCSGVKIKLDGINGTDGGVHEETWTDANGEYEFLDLVPGIYNITVVEPAGFICNYPETNKCEITNVVLESGDSMSGMEFYFGDLSYAEINLIKYDDLDGDGTRDPGEPGVPGVNFTLFGYDGMNNYVEITNETDANGELSFLDLWPGNYTLLEEVPADREPSTGAIKFFELTSDEVVNVEFGNYIPAEKHGMKFIDMDGDGVYNSGVDKNCADADPVNKPGCEGVEVHLDGKDGKGNVVNETTWTDANGTYSFTGLKPGKYNVTVVEDGFFCSFPSPCRHEIELESGDNETGNNFGDFLPVNISAYKFFDFNHNGVKDENEEYMSGITICLNDSDGNPVTEDLYGLQISPDGCQETDSNGVVEWNNIAPGTYTLYLNESIPGMCGSTLTEQTVTVLSGEVNVSWFGNYGPCNGLTPGYWYNWDNHYTETEFLDLLEGTIADGNITLANYTLSSIGCDNGDALHCMERFLLANQLTLNMMDYPGYFQGGGSLFEECLIEGKEYLGTLGDALADALEIHNNPGSYTREEILAMKNILAGFAEQKNKTSCPLS